MLDLHVVVHPANEQLFFAQVKLKRLAQLETQRHPVRLAISLLESCSRNFMRLTLPIISMVITFLLSC